MASLVQQSTTQLALKFYMVLTSDHISAATGLTPTVTIRKEGGSFASPSGSVTEIANGWYQVAGNATDTNTLGEILLHATAGTADPSDVVAAMVVAFNPQNANLGLSNVSANVAQWNGTNVSSPATAGVPDVNVKNYNNQTAATDANNLPKVDVVDWNATAVGALPTNFSSLVINGSGAVSVQSNVKKNTGLNNFPFTMTDSTTHSPTTGKTVTAQLSLDGAAFVSATNSVVEVANGDYKINLAAADVNANTVQMRFTATGCDDLNIIIITDP